jgi:hypothetical protein
MDSYQDKMLKELMGIYDSKDRSWEYNEELNEDEEWVDEGMNEIGPEFAITLMDELTANNLDSHVLLKYPEIADWWGGVLKERKKKAEALRKREEAKRKAEEDKHARESLLARLTPEERRLLGVK